MSGEYVLAPPNKTGMTGPEKGRPVKNGVARFVDPYGSYRYVLYVDGSPVSGLQVMSRDGGKRGVIAMVHTDHAHRRKGYAARVLARARQDMIVEHSPNLTDDGAAWSKAVNPDEGLRALERRAYDSDEDFLRYSAARIRAGLGPVARIVEQKDLFRPFVRGTLYLVHRRKAWGSILSELNEWRPMWLEHDGDKWVAIYDRGKQANEENATAEAQRLALGDLRHRRNPPGRDDAIAAAWREWQATDDPLALERLMGERQRAGLDPKPEHPEFKEMQAAAVAEGWKPGKKRPTIRQAQAALIAWFKQRGWKGDFRATFDPGRGVGGRRGHHLVVISPDEQRRATFLNSTIVFEKGGRGRWEKDYAFHAYGQPLTIIDAALRIMTKKAAKPLTREDWKTPMQNPPGADDELRRLTRAVQSGDAEAAFRMIQPEFGARYRGGEHKRNAGFAALILTPRRWSPLKGRKPTIVEWDWELLWPEKYSRSGQAKSKKAALRVPEMNVVPTGFLPDKVLIVEDYNKYRGAGGPQAGHGYHGDVFGATRAYFADYPGLARMRAASEEAEARRREALGERGRFNEDMYRMTNPPEKDVVYSLASLSQHGRTSTTLQALVATTGRPPEHVARVVRALAERGLVVVRGPLVIFDRRIVHAAVGGPAVGRKANPGADERRRALQRQAQREQEVYGLVDPALAAQVEREASRVTVPALGDRAYLRDILTAWGVGEHGTGWVSVGVASKGLQAVFKKAKIKAGFRSSSYSMGSHIAIGGESEADNEKIGKLFGESPRRWVDGSFGYTKNWTVHPNAREDKSDSQTDYFEPGGVTLPADYFATYAEAVQKALGSKGAAKQKKEEKLATKAAARASAITLDEDYGAPVDGKRYLFDVRGKSGGVWESGQDYETGPESRGRIYEFTRVGKKGELLNKHSAGNSMWLSWKEWVRALKAGVVKYGPTSNPGMAVLGWAGNPGGLTLPAARKRLKSLLKLGHETLINELVAQTRPRDRDKLKAEIAHFRRKMCRSSNPGKGRSRGLGRQQGGKKRTVTMEQAIAMGVDKAPGFAKALAHYRKFHGADPHSVDVYVYDNEKGKADSKVVVTMGQVPETQYVVPDGKDSNKAGHHWVHKHREKGKGKEPNLLFDPVSGTMQIAGGTYKVTRWIYH